MARTLTITGYNAANKLPAIQAIRAITHCDLRDAKDSIEMLDRGCEVKLPLRDLTLRAAQAIAARGYVIYKPPSRAQRLRERLRSIRWPKRPEGGSRFWYPLPVHVTRPLPNGGVGTITVPAGIVVIGGMLLAANLSVWSLIGLYEAVRVIAG